MQKTTERLNPRFIDFWLLGGASIVIWFFCALAQSLRSQSTFINLKLQQVAPTLTLLALFVNHPHFISSYRMAYSRDFSFYKKNWVPMIAVPIFLFVLYAEALLHLQTSLFNVKWILPINSVFKTLGFGYQLGETSSLGVDLLGVSVWLMYLTVGWHYSKQVFGCIMVYANYDAYPVSQAQRLLLKLSVYSIAFYSFCHISLHWQNYSEYTSSYSFLGIPLTEMGLPHYFEQVADGIVTAGFAAIIYGVFYKNYRQHKKLPTINFLSPLIAFYIWWIPVFPQREYYLMFVPFFHSLQYLPFAYRMELAEVENKSRPLRSFSLRMLLLLLIGFIAFEAAPTFLDYYWNDKIGGIAFFALAFVVFINIHHFFLDSILWRFQDKKMHDIILSRNDVRRS